MALDRVHHAVSGLGLLLAAVGCGWTVWAIRTAGLTRILGRPTPPPALVLRGPYRFVRHPCCSGLLVFLLGISVGCPGWVTTACFGVGLVGCGGWVALQDRRRTERFGEAYRRYQEAVPALVPSWWRRRRRGGA